MASSSPWVPLQDPTTGDVFYFNEVTGESRWTKPGWNKLVDADTGAIFWYNEDTAESVWDRPDGYESDDPAATGMIQPKPDAGTTTAVATTGGSGGGGATVAAVSTGLTGASRRPSDPPSSPSQRRQSHNAPPRFMPVPGDLQQSLSQSPALSPSPAVVVRPQISKIGRATAALRNEYLTLDRLKRIPLLHNISEADAAVCSASFSVQAAPATCIVADQGEQWRFCGIIVSGTVVQVLDGTETTLHPGAVIGEVALLKDGCSVNCRIEATTDAELLSITRAELIQALGSAWFQASLRALISADFRHVGNFLDDVPFFKDLSSDTLTTLAVNSSLLMAPAGQVLVRESYPGDAFFLLLDGVVRVTARGRRLADLRSGSYIGETSIMQDVACTASVSTLEASLLLTVPRAEFHTLLTKVPGMADTLAAHMHQRTASRVVSMKVPLFHGVPESQLLMLSQVMRYRQFASGQVIFEEGTQGDTCFVVTQGVVNLVKKKTGAVSQGAEALVSATPRPCTATAATVVACLEFAREDIGTMFSGDMDGLGRFELSLLREDALMSHVLRYPPGFESFASFVEGVTHRDVLQFLKQIDDFQRERSRQPTVTAESLAMAQAIVDVFLQPTSTTAVTKLVSRDVCQRICTSVAVAADETDVTAAVLPAYLFAELKNRVSTSALTSQFANFKASHFFRSLLRSVPSPFEAVNPVKSVKVGRFVAEKANRYGQWQSRILTFDVDQCKLMVLDGESQDLHTFSLLAIDKIDRSNAAPRKLKISFRDNTRDYVLRFDTPEIREQFCMVAYLLEPDLVFTDDCESSESESCVCYDVFVVSTGVKKRRLLSVDSESRTLSIAGAGKDGAPAIYPLDASMLLETSRSDQCRVVIIASSGAERIEVAFPTASARQRFSGRVRALCEGINLAQARVLGLWNIGYRGRELSVHTVTWNVGEGKPPKDDPAFTAMVNAGAHDVYVFGLQECDHRDEWVAALDSIFCPAKGGGGKVKSFINSMFKSRSSSTAERPESTGRRTSMISTSDEDWRRYSLDRVMSETRLADSFAMYLASQNVLHFMEFHRAVDSFRIWAFGKSPEVVHAEAATLVDRFVLATIGPVVPVSPRVRAKLNAAVQSGRMAATALDEAQRGVGALLESQYLGTWQKTASLDQQQQDTQLRIVQAGDYVQLCVASLWGIHLVIYARANVAREITHLQSATEACGVGGVMGNKGAVAVSFVYRDATSFAFVTSHLAARAKRCKQRAENYAQICGHMHLGEKSLQFLHQFHHVFWMGDLNYRIVIHSPHDETLEDFNAVTEMVEARTFWKLRKLDQLCQEISAGHVFLNFREGLVNFAPTYRMEKGKAGYSNKRNQNPSWTDRVLWRSFPGYRDRVAQIQYQSHPALMQSDHRPVSATFNVRTMLPFLNIDSGSGGSNYGQCHISIAFMSFVPEAKPVVEKHPVIEDIVPTHQPATAATAAGSASGGAAGAAAGASGTGDANDTASGPLGALQVHIQAPFLSNPTITEAVMPSATNEWQWLECHTPLIIPFIDDANWLQHQHLVLSIRQKGGALVGQAELFLMDANNFVHIPAEELTLTQVLSTPDLSASLEEMLRADNDVSSLEFYRAVEQYHKMFPGTRTDAGLPPPPANASSTRRQSICVSLNRSSDEAAVSAVQLEQAVREVMDTFIVADAPLKIALPEAVAQATLASARVSPPAVSVFDDALAEVARSLAVNVFPRFRRKCKTQQEINQSRGGGAPFKVDVVCDGLRVGTLQGQALLQTFDRLREREDRIAVMNKFIHRQEQTSSSDSALAAAYNARDDGAESKQLAEQDFEVEDDILAQIIAEIPDAAGSSDSSPAAATLTAAQLHSAVQAALAKTDGDEEHKRLRVLLKLTYDRLKQATAAPQ